MVPASDRQIWYEIPGCSAGAASYTTISQSPTVVFIKQQFLHVTARRRDPQRVRLCPDRISAVTVLKSRRGEIWVGASRAGR